MKPVTAKRLRLLASGLTVLAALILIAGTWFYFRMRGSLPRLDGEVALSGITARTTIERDALGVPTLRGTSRADVARALGFVHAQDRFFQMDLARRRAAGELAELVGKDALPLDKRTRIHGFRTLARAVLDRLPAPERDLLEAYAAGVNAGLKQLRTKPFEYLLLRTEPAPWLSEDCVLMQYMMALDLQEEDGNYEQSIAAVRDTLGLNVLGFFAPLIAPGDAPLDNSVAPAPAMPTQRMIDLRTRQYEVERKRFGSNLPLERPEVLPGSNAIALAGSHTATGGAIVANDMHLSLRVPNVWYRASLVFPGADGAEKRITGVTLPGTPLVIAGSNGHIAWGFTNSFADVSDLVVINPASNDSRELYSHREDILLYEKRTETIRVKGDKPVTIETPWTIWGPVVGKNADNRDYALRWTAHDPDAFNFALVGLESAKTVQEAIDIAHRAGIPPQNFVVGDSAGNIGWTICGRLPKRAGFDGRLPASWAFGDRNWDGYLSAAETPTLIAPAGGRLWSGNQRMIGGDGLERIGDGGYERPVRATRLRDLLARLEKAGPRDMLGIQLSIAAPHLDRWQKLMLQVLSPEATGSNKDRARLREAIEKWDGQASVDSVSYRLVDAFRNQVVERIVPVVFEPCYNVYEDFNIRHFRYDEAVWETVQSKPMHLLGQDFATWDDLLLASVDAVVKEVKDEHGSVRRATWGRHNTARIRHPLSSAVGPFARWLDMPADPLPGDNDMPRVQSPTSGASERFAVEPGREQDGVFHMPGGQSGHPLSPYYRAGHSAWVKGEPTPFLPGATVHTLVLTP